MRNAEDMQELDDWYRDDEPPPRACPECGDDDRHAPDCPRNYKNMRSNRTPDADPHAITETYWLGWRHGRRVAEYAVLVDYEPALREEVKLVGTRNRIHRAFSLGELRGYREAQNDRA